MTLPVIDLIAAARPNFMKVAPLFHELKAGGWCRVRLIHTGQHYDPNMSQAFFDDLNLPEPDEHLGVGSGTHAQQTAAVMTEYEAICLTSPPDWTIVVGDVNSTMACSIVCAKLHIPIAHLEAGLRSWDRSMPEEINRILTDSIANLLWTPSSDGNDNLRAEGVPEDRIELIGNIMIDSFEMMRDRIEADTTRKDLGFDGRRYGVVTLHRPSNVDDAGILQTLVNELGAASQTIPLIFAVHPRTRKQLQAFDLEEQLAGFANIELTDPFGYIQFMNLVTAAALVITDSGGIQEETTYLGIPCLTVRNNTERPITVSQGTNRLIRPETVSAMVTDALDSTGHAAVRPELWDGKTATRAAASLKKRLGL